MCNEALERMRRGIAGPRELELWRMQVAALEVRNHVCLVLSTRRRGDQLTATAVTLSRLKASVVDRSLARRILYGEREGGVPTRAEAEVQAGSEAAAEAVVEAEGEPLTLILTLTLTPTLTLTLTPTTTPTPTLTLTRWTAS